MKTIKKDNVLVKRFKKGLYIKIEEDFRFSSSIALTEEEFKILKDIFSKLK